MIKWRNIGLFLLKCWVYVSLGFVFLHILFFIIVAFTPKLDIRNASSIYMYDKDKNVFFQGNGYSEWVSLNKMSKYIKDATISIEDKNFYYHDGFDYLRIIKTMIRNIKAGKVVAGASTITQQYAKNLFLEFNKSWKRKIEEAWLSFEIEYHYDKGSILEGYLNSINYGNGVFGIENASKYYFNKSASDLTLAEATILAGIPKSPNNFSPLNNEKKAKERQLLILKSMVKNKYISESDKEDAYNQKLTYIGKKEKYNLTTLMYYQDAVMGELKKLGFISDSLINSKSLKVYTNLDINAQTILENSMNNNLKTNKDIQAAIVMVEPSNGNIIALTGGRDYSKSEFNRATTSKRQVGSTIKPFLYYAALENGLTATSTFLSEPTVFTLSKNKTYAPNNFGNIYPGKSITMAAAIAYSDNIYAIKTHLFLGEDVLVKTLKRVGIKQKIDAVPSLPLGTEEINIIDYLTGYTTLADEGNTQTLHFISRIEDIKGNILYEYKPYSERVLNSSTVFILNELLSNTYDQNMIDYTYPTCIGIAPKITRKYAIKSGTTDYDAWAIGYNKDILVGVWNGFDNNNKLPSGASSKVKNIWVDIVENYLKGKENNWYKMPDDVVGLMANPITGETSNNDKGKKKLIYYIKGTEPLSSK